MNLPKAIWTARSISSSQTGDAQSLLDLTLRALAVLVRAAARKGVKLAWTMDPELPAYISVRRIDLFSIISVLVRRALQLVDQTPLHLGVHRLREGQVELLLEDTGETSAQLPDAEWQQLRYWVEELGGELRGGGDGLQWRIRLPLDPLEASQIRIGQHRGLRVLVACADTDTRIRILQLLQAGKHMICECTHAREALLLARRQRFDLLLLDRDLPGNENGDLEAQLRALTPKRQIIATMVAGEVRPHHRIVGIASWLHKPPYASELYALLERSSLEARGLPPHVAASA